MKALALGALIALSLAGTAAAAGPPIKPGYVRPAEPIATIAAPKPVATPKPKAVVATEPKATKAPRTVLGVTAEPGAALKVTATCSGVTVDAGEPAWILIYAHSGGVLPTAEQERIIDADAPTGVQKIAVDLGSYEWDVSVTYSWAGAVEDRSGSVTCP